MNLFPSSRACWILLPNHPVVVVEPEGNETIERLLRKAHYEVRDGWEYVVSSPAGSWITTDVDVPIVRPYTIRILPKLVTPAS